MLLQLTLPNVRANFGGEVARAAAAGEAGTAGASCECRYVSGDWRCLGPLLLAAGGQYGLVLSSDTLYNDEAMADVLALLTQVLAPGGRAYLASKALYFGVGGGTHAFAALLSQTAGLEGSVVAEFSDGMSNVREILLVTRTA